MVQRITTDLRILVIGQNLPYPTFSGIDLRNWQNINGLMTIGRVAVFGVCSRDPRSIGARAAQGLAYYRSSSDPKLAFQSPKEQQLAASAWLLEDSGHPSDIYYSDMAADELKTLLKEFNPEIVVLEGLWVQRYIDLVKRHHCRVILDCHNVEALLTQYGARWNVGIDQKTKFLGETLQKRTRRIERRALHAVDQIWVCSPEDAQQLKDLYSPQISIHVVPNALNVRDYESVSTDEFPAPKEPAGSDKTLIFPGMFAHWPNRDAACFLIEEIFPRLVEIFPASRLLLAGSWPAPQMIAAAHKDSRIMITGAVENMLPYLANSSVMVVPLFAGSGTRFKILEAFATKVPVISTAKGAEGLDVESEKHLLVAESAEEFVECILRLWTNEALAEKLKSGALELVSQQYSWEVTGSRIRSAIDEIQTEGPHG